LPRAGAGFNRRKNKMIIRSRSPVRITFAGGGTDIPPYDKEHGGLCIGATIDKYVYSSLIPREDKKIEITLWDSKSKQTFKNLEELSYDGNGDLVKAVIKKMKPSYGFDLFVRSEVKQHSGLGASASAASSVIGSFNYLRKEDKLDKYQIAELAYIIEEEEIKNIGGRQDQYASVFGGINLYKFKGKDFVQVSPIDIKENVLLELRKNILLVYAGKREQSSGEIHMKEQKENQNKTERLHEVKEVAKKMEFILREGKLGEFGNLIKESWEKKVGYNPDVTNKRINSLIETALENGAIGARLMGAGGGGHLLVYCNSNTEQIVAQELEESGAKVIPFSFDFTGLKTWEVNE
jgi:D-glycero-alpha-D-manno-heptose-7-phosphate kinase